VRNSTYPTSNVDRAQCPLWVKSRHVQCTTSCLLYPRKRHQLRHNGMSTKGQKRTRTQHPIDGVSSDLEIDFRCLQTSGIRPEIGFPKPITNALLRNSKKSGCNAVRRRRLSGICSFRLFNALHGASPSKKRSRQTLLERPRLQPRTIIPAIHFLAPNARHFPKIKSN